ncbi:MAG: hypothetical protein ACLQU5_14660 [Isosphaeraceae bacterium]
MGRPKKPFGEGLQVRFPRDLATMAKRVAERQGIDLVTYFDKTCRRLITKDFNMVLAETKKELDQGSK